MSQQSTVSAISENIAESVAEMEGKYLTFFTASQLFGVSIADVVQIVGMQEITGIPEFPHYAKGVINLRGNIIPVVDMRLRLGKPEKEYDERTCIIVTLIDNKSVGFIVDAVDAVTSIDDESISEPPTMSTSGGESYLTGVAKHEDRVVLLINIVKVLSEEVVDAISSVE